MCRTWMRLCVISCLVTRFEVINAERWGSPEDFAVQVDSEAADDIVLDVYPRVSIHSPRITSFTSPHEDPASLARTERPYILVSSHHNSVDNRKYSRDTSLLKDLCAVAGWRIVCGPKSGQRL